MKTTPDPNWSRLSDEGVWRLQRLAFPLALGYTHKEVGASLEESSAWVSAQLADLRDEVAAGGVGDRVTLVRLCPACGCTLPAVPHTRGKCGDCRREYDRKRGKTRARGYDSEHKRLAKLAIAQHPYCVDCDATTDLCADHIIPSSRGGLNVLANYAVRCRSCNTSRRNREAAFLTSADGDPGPGLREKHSRSPEDARETPRIG